MSRGGIQLGVSDTNERINIEKLKKGGKIQFYAEMVLFEDELHDSGTSMLKVQIVSSAISSLDVVQYWIRIIDTSIKWCLLYTTMV